MIRLDRLQTYRCSNAAPTESWIGSKILTAVDYSNYPVVHYKRQLTTILHECSPKTYRSQSASLCLGNCWYMPSTHSSLHHSEHLYRKQMIRQSGSNIFRLKQPPTSQSPLPTPRETSIERSCPAYILLNASPFSAHSSRWNVQRLLEWIHSRRTRRRYCSKVWRERRSWMKFVRSRLVYRMLWAINR